jgi:glycosyltransferase involved in cell wall biosynthesis
MGPHNAADQQVTARSLDLPATSDVSVVMPVHDMPIALVNRAIRSVREQDHAGPIEIVLWDDGSRDPVLRAAYEAIAGASVDDVTTPGERTILTIRSEERRGIAHSRNDAVRRARADWLIWLDGDDELPPAAISNLLAAVRTSGNPYVVGQCRVVHPGGAVQVHRNDRYLATWREKRGSEADPLANVVFNVHGGLVRRDLFDRTDGFDPFFSHAELVDWFRRLVLALPHPDAFDVLDEVTYVCHRRRGSQSSDRAHVEPQRVAALQRYATAAGVPPAALDAPMTNIETGCPEYKRVQLPQASADVELLGRVPACP